MTRSILISSAGRRVALLESFRAAGRALGVGSRIVATDVSAAAAAFQRADVRHRVPRCDDPAFIPALLEVCEREDVALVVPTIDPELPVLAAHRDEFAARGTVVAVSSPEMVSIGSDKRLTHEWLTRHGFPTVRQVPLAEARDKDDWPLPLVVKPARGSASIGVEVVTSAPRLATFDDPELVVQTVAPGIEHTVDLFVDRAGRVRCAVPRRRIETRGGEVSKAVTISSAPLVALTTELVEALPGPFGALNVQVFVDDDGGCAVIEINARFGGGYPLAQQAGADFPRWILEEVHGFPSTAEQGAWRAGLVMLRYDDAVFVEAADAGLDP